LFGAVRTATSTSSSNTSAVIFGQNSAAFLGSFSEALAWLRAIGAALVQIGRNGEVVAHSVPFGYDGHPIRRAQALAVTNGSDLAIARELIASSWTDSAGFSFGLGPICASSTCWEPRSTRQIRSSACA
jgi:hypothetical protein